MGKIFVIMGKTSSGKDTVFKYLLEHLNTNQGVQRALRTVVIYTTRPMRPGETDGVEYFFVTEERLQELRAAGKVIEERRFDTVHGPWYYFTVNDGQIDLEQYDYLMINTLAGYEMIREYFKNPVYAKAEGKEESEYPEKAESKEEAEYPEKAEGKEEAECSEKVEPGTDKETVIPVYIEADAKERLLRYIHRESLQEKPNYCEVCRRFLADEADFSEAELARLQITRRYFNRELEECCREIARDMEALF